MLIICNNLTTEKPEIKEAVENKNSSAINNIVAEAKEAGFNALELYAGNTDDEASNLLFLAQSVENSELTLVLRVKNLNTYEAVLPSLKVAGLINPVDISDEQAANVFPLIKKLADGWKLILTQTYNEKDTIHSEVEGLRDIIVKAELEGILPERIYFEPVGEPMVSSKKPFIKMKRMLDAFRNGYPSMNFYLNLSLVADGLVNQDVLMDVYIGLSTFVGVNAFAFDLSHKAHIQAIEAAVALCDDGENFQNYLGK